MDAFTSGDERFPLVFTLLARPGRGIAPPARRARGPGVYFLLFFGIGLLFYAGSYNYGADVRYSLMTYPPLAALGGLGAARIAGRIARWRPQLPAFALVAAGLVFQFLWYVPLVRATTEEAWAARADVRFAEVDASGAPRELLRTDAQPGHVPCMGRQRRTDVAGRDESRATWNTWPSGMQAACTCIGISGAMSTTTVQRAFCRNARDVGPAELVGEARERDQRFAFYRFKSAAGP